MTVSLFENTGVLLYQTLQVKTYNPASAFEYTFMVLTGGSRKK